MRGEIKTMLMFLEKIGKCKKTEHLSDEVAEEYSIELDPGYSEIPLLILNQLQDATDCRVTIWFYDTDDGNRCQICLQVLRK